MPLLKILHPDEVIKYDMPPLFSAEERKSAFYLSTLLLDVLKGIHSPTNKVCFIIQYGYFKVNHRFYSTQCFHQKDIDFVAKRLHIDYGKIEVSAKYFRNKSAEHQQSICDLQGFTKWSGATLFMLLKSSVMKRMRYFLKNL